VLKQKGLLADPKNKKHIFIDLGPGAGA